MKTLNLLCLTLLLALPILFTQSASALEWPQEVVGDTGRIIVYQPQPENLKGNRLTGRADMALVLDDSEPRYSPIGNSDYERVINAPMLWSRTNAAPTTSPMASSGTNPAGQCRNLTRTHQTGKHRLLLSGRWFRSKSEDGPWTFVRADELPPAFSEIPPASDLGGLRTSVAGTPEAEEAVLDAQIPQTAAISRDVTLEVTYEGPPQFEPVTGTSVSYAVNTSTQVLKTSHRSTKINYAATTSTTARRTVLARPTRRW